MTQFGLAEYQIVTLAEVYGIADSNGIIPAWKTWSSGPVEDPVIWASEILGFAARAVKGPKRYKVKE